MTQTIEESAKEYADKIAGNMGGFNAVYKAYMEGANQVFAMPLASRLTDAEKKAIRLMHADTFPNDIDQSLTGKCIMYSLEKIFGKEFFKDNYK